MAFFMSSSLLSTFTVPTLNAELPSATPLSRNFGTRPIARGSATDEVARRRTTPSSSGSNEDTDSVTALMMASMGDA